MAFRRSVPRTVNQTIKILKRPFKIALEQGLIDRNPVPCNFRRGSDIPKILVLHEAQLMPSEIIRERGYAVTTPIRTISDLAGSGEVERDTIAEALREGQKRGVITLQEITKARSCPQNPEWLQRLLEEAR